ncbi:CPBP family intramembrane glutamic endopeptidase [Spiroplasma floricola]|uniref:CAAX amino terminal membrane bound protease n=1 Tax=Spiroplasma floricola 23-6 TaxID=1336749 RepID=A0A2K8SCH7_9MOLU|nr:CPBP family intramembrane glutamic endopeptidase [Spiroplasma floricola]AUB31169.1 CAAX amino terminal membrane bound protease [Spiroplasma floricola 23-6]
MKENSNNFWTNLKNKNNNFRSKHFDLSEEARFRFDILNYKIDGMIFVTSVLIVPLILSLFIPLVADSNSAISRASAFSILYIISVSIGMIFNCIRNRAGFFKGGYLWIYMFILGPQIVSIIIFPLLRVFLKGNVELTNSFASLITMIVTEVIIITLALIYDRKIFKRVKETIKNKWKEIILVTIICTALMFIFVTFIIQNLIETKLIGVGESNNQGSLVSILKEDKYGLNVKIVYAIMLFILTVIVASFCEELCLRNSFNLNASNRWLGFVSSSLFFGFIHWGPNFDFGHIMSYSAAGFILSGIFLYTKGNMTFSWFVHMLNNLIAFILIFAI